MTTPREWSFLLLGVLICLGTCIASAQVHILGAEHVKLACKWQAERIFATGEYLAIRLTFEKTYRFAQKILDILGIYGIITSQYNFCSFPRFCIKCEKLLFFIYGEKCREEPPRVVNCFN